MSALDRPVPVTRNNGILTEVRVNDYRWQDAVVPSRVLAALDDEQREALWRIVKDCAEKVDPAPDVADLVVDALCGERLA